MASTGRANPPAVLIAVVAVAAMCLGAVAEAREWPPRIDHFGVAARGYGGLGRKRAGAGADRMAMFRSATFGKRFGAGGGMLSASFGKRFGSAGGGGGLLSASFGKRYGYGPVRLSNGRWPGNYDE